MAPIFTLDRRFRDSTGAFFVNELTRLDPKLYEPLADVTWSRDMALRSDVTIADESSAYMQSSFASVGGINPGGKNWLATTANDVPGVEINGSLTTTPIRPWAISLSYTEIELARAQQLGRPLGTQKFAALNLKHQMDIDEQVYMGDKPLGAYGLCNSPKVDVLSASVKSGSVTAWDGATPDQILADVNALVAETWKAAAYAVCPDKLLLPPVQFGTLVSKKVSEAGNVSVLQYLIDNSLSNKLNGRPLDIRPVKWLSGAGADGKDRAVVYTNDENRVRFPYVPVIRSNPWYQGLRWSTVYYAALGEVEFVYPETVRYMDGI